MIWKNLRIDKLNMHRLEEYRLGLESAVRAARHKYPEWMHGKRLSLGDVICFMLDKAEKQKIRETRRGNGRAGHSEAEPATIPFTRPQDEGLAEADDNGHNGDSPA